jgi:hypothetical protein
LAFAGYCRMKAKNDKNPILMRTCFNPILRSICGLALATMLCLGSAKASAAANETQSPTAATATLPAAWAALDKSAPELNYDGLPLREVTDDLKRRFTNQFDVLFPTPNDCVPSAAPPADWTAQSIRMQVRNVTPPEIFNALNLSFESGNVPLRWDLIVNGHRPTAVLRVLTPQFIPPPIDPATGLPVGAAPTARRVFYIGDLIAISGWNINQISETLKVVCAEASLHPTLAFHGEARLLIAVGTPETLDFVKETLSALNQRAMAESKPRPAQGITEDTKAKTQATNRP